MTSEQGQMRTAAIMFSGLLVGGLLAVGELVSAPSVTAPVPDAALGADVAPPARAPARHLARGASGAR